MIQMMKTKMLMLTLTVGQLGLKVVAHHNFVSPTSAVTDMMAFQSKYTLK